MSSTKIELEFPYNERWKFGYLNINSDGRRTLTLYNTHTDRSSTQYARYLLAVKLKRFLTEYEQADHINNDKTDDSLDNLQILSIKENNRKQANINGKIFAVIRCPVCKLEFLLRKGQTQLVPSKVGKITCCSKGCSSALRTLKLDKELRELISIESIMYEKTVRLT